MTPPIIYLAAILGSAAVLITAINAIARLISQRRTASLTLSSEEIANRLERIEQVVEATATEVERLGEASRFVAKLLADKTAQLPR